MFTRQRNLRYVEGKSSTSVKPVIRSVDSCKNERRDTLIAEGRGADHLLILYGATRFTITDGSFRLSIF